MGVMIQCETCKVWQHCPCVGLGDGQVTPDKYYCDSCRPENHPYHVVDGVLMTNAENASLVVAALKVKSPKTKSSARESKMSADRENQSDSAATEHNYQGNGTRASKRRKKTDSTLDDLDHAPIHNSNNSNSSSANSHETDDESETTPAPVTKMSKKTAAADREKSSGSASGSSKSTANKRKKGAAVTAYELSTASTSSIAVTTMTSIPDQSEESSPNGGQDSESAASAFTSAPSTRRNARSTNTKKNSRAAPVDDVQETNHIVPASKRRRTAESTARAKEESTVETEDDDKASDKDNTPAETVAEAPATRSSKGHSTRANKKADQVDDEQTESTTSEEKSPGTSEDTAKTDGAAPEVTKRGGALRKAQQNHSYHHHHSRHGSPAGTPQPTQAFTIQPTKIKYPSAKMTIPDMNKRVRQLLDYVGHAQAEMTEMKKNRDAAAAAAMRRANATAIAAAAAAAAAACDDSDTCMADGVNGSTSSSDSQAAWLSTPPRSVHEPSRSESLDPMTQQPSSSIASTTEQKQDSPIMQAGSRHGAGGQAPMTPPPQNEAGSCNTNTGNMNCNDIGSKELVIGSVSASTADTPISSSMSCLDQINKLTRELLHFQQKFGNKSEI
ncbi:hypothetical protein EC991_009912 [Linnemannia zychae]|nr:hypothetical protein EC991_009912 [Linnemannia zychae]